MLCFNGRCKKTWGYDLTSQILLGKKFSWELQGSLEDAEELTIEGFKAKSTGLIILKFNITFVEKYQVTEQSTIILEVEPAQLDSFGEKMKLLKGERDESIEL